MGLIDKRSTGVASPAIQVATETADALDAEVAANKVTYDADPAAYAGKPWTRDEFVNIAILNYIAL